MARPRSDEARGAEQEFAVAVHSVVLRLRRLGERRLGIEPIPLSEVDVLMFVMDHPMCSMSEVAGSLALQKSNASATVRHLEERGLVVRASDPGDGRRIRLRVTEQAVADRRDIDRAWTRVITEFLDGLPADERRVLLRSTDALRRLATLDLAGDAEAT